MWLALLPKCWCARASSITGPLRWKTWTATHERSLLRPRDTAAPRTHRRATAQAARHALQRRTATVAADTADTARFDAATQRAAHTALTALKTFGAGPS